MSHSVERWRLALFGAVQGVGFRPFVFRLATDLRLTGFVRNSSSGAVVEVEGASDTLRTFVDRLDSEKPAACWIAAREVSRLAPAGYGEFSIQSSDAAESKTAFLLPDLATCPDCLAEIGARGERRFQYPFTNCTRCGPRYTIINAIPYDRPNTTMATFPLCLECAAEYGNPLDRRFHAQPVACPVCGPRLNSTIAAAADSLRQGEIVALKGIGGYQLLCDARNQHAVERLRARKHREEKPFALMFPSLDGIRCYAQVSDYEAALLESVQAPIVLLRKIADTAPSVCGASPYIGCMLPYTPLHHLLMRECGFPVVATSGNRSDEPIAIGNAEAQERLGAIADRFLSHDRPIARPCDDSIVRVNGSHETILRRARGYAPLPVMVATPLRRVLAVGAHLKNAVAIALGRQVHLSQHIGDLETAEAFHHFRRTIADLCALYDFTPQIVACDLHPDYLSTQHAESMDLPLVHVQHHMAHVASCAAENDVREPYLGVAWDGTGYGTDGVIWGSEFFVVDKGEYRRVAHLKSFRLPGGEQAVRDCRRSALSLLWQSGLPLESAGVDDRKAHLLRAMLERRLNSPLTTSAGRLFDVVAVLSGIADRNAFEGQAPMHLEAAIEPGPDDAYSALVEEEDGHWILNWTALLDAIVTDRRQGASPGVIARRFHHTLACWIAEVAHRAGVERVVLSGGCFQNAYLVDCVTTRLRGASHQCFTHQRVPPNDGGIALGQAVIASASAVD